MSNDKEYTKVLKGRRVTIPMSMCKKYNIRVGDLIAVEDSGNEIKVYPIEIRKKGNVEKEETEYEKWIRERENIGQE